MKIKVIEGIVKETDPTTMLAEYISKAGDLRRGDILIAVWGKDYFKEREVRDIKICGSLIKLWWYETLKVSLIDIETCVRVRRVVKAAIVD